MHKQNCSMHKFDCSMDKQNCSMDNSQARSVAWANLFSNGFIFGLHIFERFSNFHSDFRTVFLIFEQFLVKMPLKWLILGQNSGF